MFAQPTERLPDGKLLTPKEAAVYLRSSVQTLERMRSQRVGPAWIKMGSGKRAPIRYWQSDLDAYLRANRRGPNLQAAE